MATRASGTEANHPPVFFFHGITGNPGEAVNLERALAENGTALVALSYAPSEESTQALHTQVPLAIKQVREIVATDERFQHGYVFIGHSQGGLMARAVIEEMDDHQVYTLISLAGVQNGLFYGPQSSDRVPLSHLLTGFGPTIMPGFDFDTYLKSDDPAAVRGRVQAAIAQFIIDHPELQDKFSFVNVARFPAQQQWVQANTFLPALNNLNQCEPSDEQGVQDQQRRKRNFLKLRAAHFFSSPGDDVVAPWQLSIFGQYSHVDSVAEIATKFETLKVLNMRETDEYINDTFGLKTLDERGGLFLHEVPDVPHCGWITDGPLIDDPSATCEFRAVFDKFVLPSLP